jgi:hypothetical protein
MKPIVHRMIDADGATMPTCPHRDRLISEWNKAVRDFSKSISRLKAALDNGSFADEKQATEQARLHAENARTMLNLHRAEHGC